MSADYVADFDDRREALGREAADNPGFLWSIRDRIAPPRGFGLNGSSAVSLGWNRLNVAPTGLHRGRLRRELAGESETRRWNRERGSRCAGRSQVH